jgi:hypothetical protein
MVIVESGESQHISEISNLQTLKGWNGKNLKVRQYNHQMLAGCALVFDDDDLHSNHADVDHAGKGLTSEHRKRSEHV